MTKRTDISCTTTAENDCGQEVESPGSSDFVSPSARSKIMRSVGQRDTKAELEVRRILKSLGLAYRVDNRGLPGSPDIANRSKRWAIFVNGCFWHGHRTCRKTKACGSPRIPVANGGYWEEKFVANRKRDARKCIELRALEFKVLIVWECELLEPSQLRERLARAIANESGQAAHIQ